MKRILNLIKHIPQLLKKTWKWYKSLYIGRAWYAKALTALLSAVIALIIYLGAVDINLFWLFGKSPGFIDINHPKTSEASEIYSADNVMIGKFFSENRTPVKYEEVNPVFWRALIDTEDERFYRHWGIDPIGLFAPAQHAVIGRGERGE